MSRLLRGLGLVKTPLSEWGAAEGKPDFRDAQLKEAYRRITHELSGLRGGDSKVVLVASAVHGEGASTVARQLAATLVNGQTGPVLLMDANLRPDEDGDVLNGAAAGGFLDSVPPDYIEETSSFPMSASGFSVLPSDPHDRVTLLTGKSLKKAFGKLRRRFDWIVIDGPPVTLSAEAGALSAQADATVLVLRAESTRSEVAVRARNILHQSGGHVLGAVLNRREYHIPDFLYRRL